MTRMSDGRRDSFVIRVVQARRGEISGVIERAATGANDGTRDRLGYSSVTPTRSLSVFAAASAALFSSARAAESMFVML